MELLRRLALVHSDQADLEFVTCASLPFVRRGALLRRNKSLASRVWPG
jgi:hypothetical protein